MQNLTIKTGIVFDFQRQDVIQYSYMQFRRGDLLSEESKEFINLFGRGFVGIRRCFFVIEMHGFTSQRSGFGKIGYRQGSKFQKVPKQDISLVGLGDSLTHGVGDPENNGGYVHMIKQKLNKEHNVSVTTKNFGKTGDRSDQIEKRVETSKNIQDSLKDADVITMTVGGNDLMQVMQNNFMALAANKLDKVMPKEEEKYDAKLSSLFTAVRKYNSKAPIF